MRMSNIPVPQVYRDSADFRFFLRWFEFALSKIQYDTENIVDLYDSLRCPKDLLWMLGDTIGYKYDDRLPTAFNRLVILYFMSMIRNKGSKDGVALAATVNLAQFRIMQEGILGYTDDDGNTVEPNPILADRLEDTSIPVNSVYVTPNVKKGYIDVVYFSDKLPVDACIEYVRPLGMYLFQHAGVRYDARTKVSVDPRLVDTDELGMSVGPTHVGHYRREDYARIQKVGFNEGTEPTSSYSEFSQSNLDPSAHSKHLVYHSNSKYEMTPEDTEAAGYRALYNLQLCNNEHIVKSLISKPIFELGYDPQPDGAHPEYNSEYSHKAWNLRYDRATDESNPEFTHSRGGKFDVYTSDDISGENTLRPHPAVNPIMGQLGDSISINDPNTQYTVTKDDGTVTTEEAPD